MLAQGGLSAGYALHLKAGLVVFAVRTGGEDALTEISSPADFAKPMRITASLGADATMSLKVDDQPAVVGKAMSLVPRQPAEGFSLGHDSGKPVAAYSGNAPFKGAITHLKITVP